MLLLKSPCYSREKLQYTILYAKKILHHCFSTHRRNTANHPKPPQTTPNHRTPPNLYMITVKRSGNGCDIATIRAPLAFKYASVGMEGSGKC